MVRDVSRWRISAIAAVTMRTAAQPQEALKLFLVGAVDDIITRKVIARRMLALGLDSLASKEPRPRNSR